MDMHGVTMAALKALVKIVRKQGEQIELLRKQI
jgi:hypothetical protein